MNKKLLSLIRENARLSDDRLAAMLNMTPEEVRHDLAEMEQECM